jgi:hypothetical protein
VQAKPGTSKKIIGVADPNPRKPKNGPGQQRRKRINVIF